jgi:Mor family transcriptional regulator
MKKISKLEFSDLIVLELFEELIIKFGGANYYIPKISSLDNFVDRHIKTNKDKTYKQLARDLNVSENFIKKRIAKK